MKEEWSKNECISMPRNSLYTQIHTLKVSTLNEMVPPSTVSFSVLKLLVAVSVLVYLNLRLPLPVQVRASTSACDCARPVPLLVTKQDSGARTFYMRVAVPHLCLRVCFWICPCLFPLSQLPVLGSVLKPVLVLMPIFCLCLCLFVPVQR